MTEKPNTAQQAEIDAAMQKIDADLEKNDQHPIVKRALILMQTDEGAWWPQGMPIENVDELRVLVDESIKEKTVVKAMYDLIRVATAVGAAPTGKMAGGHLLRLCDELIKAKGLMAIVKADAEFAPGVLEKAKGAIGDTSKANAPKLGEKAPAGTLKVDQLGPNSKRRI